MSKWEKGEASPSIDYLPMLAVCLDCDINALFAKDQTTETNCRLVATFMGIMVRALYHNAHVIDAVGPFIDEHPWITEHMEVVGENLIKHKTVNTKTIQTVFDCDENFAKVFIDYLVELEELEKLDVGDAYFVMKDAVEGFTTLIKFQKHAYEIIKEKETH